MRIGRVLSHDSVRLAAAIGALAMHEEGFWSDILTYAATVDSVSHSWLGVSLSVITLLMCRIQHDDEAPYPLTDGKFFIIPKPGGSDPDYMRFISLSDSTGKLFFGCWLSYVLIQTLAVWFH